ncbi:MAG: hypothetical protein ACR652_00445 [Methylocystis sp.]|uniref:hypothetical protein n=1 Tax=Methylocystis sp. TaxID=1911079 RepID=UPI003DA25418
MPASAKFPVINRNIVFGGNGVFSPETRAAAFADMAGRSIAEIDKGNDAALGRDVHYRTFVDGRETANLRSAKDTSAIVARWDLTPGVISYIDGLLANSGPTKTGAYRNSRVIYADGVEIDDPQKAAGAREVLFMSLVPYARKIERGKKGYAPGHVYEAVAAMAKARFGNLAMIKFTYAEPEGRAPALDHWAATSQTAARQRKTKGRDNPRRQPAILVYL